MEKRALSPFSTPPYSDIKRRVSRLTTKLARVAIGAPGRVT